MESRTELDMTCREFWSQMPELESEPGEFEHLRECSACQALLGRQRAVATGLRQIAANSKTLEAPARVERKLLAAFRNVSSEPVPEPVSLWPTRPWAWLPAVAAVLILAVLLVWNLHPRGPGARFASLEADDASGWDTDFIPLPYAVGSAVSDDADLVHVQVSRSTLAAWGVPLADESGDAIEAEVLLGAGGAPQAVRLLP
jgi:hypothetical protein